MVAGILLNSTQGRDWMADMFPFSARADYGRIRMLEIEMKFPVNDFASIEEQMAQWHANRQPTIDETDRYFNAPDRDFAKTDEAFRLRCVGEANRLTYKGPKQPGVTKTRTEIEIAIEPGEDSAAKFCQLAQHLGYRLTAIVKKRRTCYEFERDGFKMQACCDEVETLGQFVEIEIVTDEQQKERAQALLLKVVQQLNLPASEPRSYLAMVLQKSKGKPA
jgi:adenylate cyclase class 2